MPDASEEERPWSVGSTVRIPLPDYPKVTRRSVVATFDQEYAVILWGKEDCYPSRFPAQSGPLICPTISTKGVQDVEFEIPLADLKPLLEFEKEGPPVTQTPRKLEKSTLLRWKDRGDQLLKLGDGASALPYYEYALDLTFLAPTIGSTILVKQKGYILVAEVDCVNDDKTIDIVWKETQEEASLKQSQNLLTVLEPHNDNVQERILLNMTRCLIQMAEVSPKYRAEYAEAATLAASLAHELAVYHDPSSDRVATALLLRAQAHATRQKFAHATQDLQRILNSNAQHKQAQAMLREVQKKQKYAQRMDILLVREVSKWVDTATGGGAATEPKQRRSKYDKETKEAEEPESSDFWSFFSCSNLE